MILTNIDMADQAQNALVVASTPAASELSEYEQLLTFIALRRKYPYDRNNRVPREVVSVLQWDQKKTEAGNKPEGTAWLVDCVADKARGVRVWMRDEAAFKKMLGMEETAALPAIILDAEPKCGFKNGLIFKNNSVQLTTCGGVNRPSIVFRAYHEEIPHEGIKARSFEKFKTDPIFFQKCLQSHLEWLSRKLSPFLSVTTDFRKAVRMCCIAEAKGKKGIKLLVIDTTSKDWDHKQSRMWHLPYLLHSLDVACRHEVDDEYLIEHSIPRESILLCVD
jgi:hypothetical protein